MWIKSFMLLTALGQLTETFVTATYVNFVPNDSALALTDSERPALVVEGDEQVTSPNYSLQVLVML
jgi:hypothetical protein